MSHFTILIPSDFTSESAGSSASLVILLDTKVEVIVVHAVLPEIAPEAEAAIVASPTPVLDLAIESDLEVEPSKAPPSPDYILVSPIHALSHPEIFRAKVIENQVMAAPVISISSDSSEESVGSHAPRVILFGAIPAIIPVIPEVPIVLADPIVTPKVGTVSVVSPAGVLDLVDYSSSSDSDPLEDSLPLAPDLSLVSPFLCYDDIEANGESEPAKQRPAKSRRDVSSILLLLQSPTYVFNVDIPTTALLITSKGLDFHTHQSQAKIASTQQQIIYSKEEHMEVDTADAEAVADVGRMMRSLRRRLCWQATREIVVDPFAIGDSSESSRGGIPDLEDTNYDIFHYMSEVHIDRITEIKTTQRQLETKRDRIDSIRWHMALSQEEFRQVRRDRDDTRRRLGGWSRITMTITRSGMTPEAIEELINRRVEEALAAHEATRAANALEAENQSQNGSDDDNGNGDNRDGENRNGGNGNGGNGNPN
ncbi:hypothetical protein Tco_0858831 [Tanacetum coccineum]|uniref:Uncharacterized protein n=1 Tax=Tanacetum coccineum TaxID=301880 RepID=A0ABQ5BEA1_9ASTR